MTPMAVASSASASEIREIALGLGGVGRQREVSAAIADVGAGPPYLDLQPAELRIPLLIRWVIAKGVADTSIVHRLCDGAADRIGVAKHASAGSLGDHGHPIAVDVPLGERAS